MKKVIFTVFAGIFSLLTANAQGGQPFLERVIVPTGGNFMAPGNKIKLHSFNFDNEDVTVIQEFSGDFSNSVVTNKHFSFVHAGRAFGHPQGGDRIYKVNTVTGAIVDSSDVISGVQNLLWIDNKLCVTRGFGASENYFIVLNANDLSDVIFVDDNINERTSGIINLSSNVIVSYTKNNKGYIRKYNALNFSQYTDWELDTLSSGAGNMLLIGGAKVLMVSEKFNPNTFALEYASVTILDFLNNTYQSFQTPRANNLITIKNEIVYGNFGTSNLFNLNTNQVVDVSIFSLPNYTAGIFLEEYNEQFALVRTDFISTGTLSFHSLINGVENSSFNTDISGSSIAVARNLSPQKTINELDINISEPAGTVLEYDLSLYFTDDQEEDLSFEIVAEPVVHTASINNTILSITIEDFVSETFAVAACDVWNRCTELDINVNNFINSLSNLSPKVISIYPNPASDYIFFKNIASDVSVELLDLSGKLVRSLINFNSNSLDIKDLKTGIYFVKINDGEKTHIEKIIKH